MPRGDYEERRQARIDRLHGRSEKAQAESHAAWEAECKLGDQIPLGQPILVGHHSERGHRALIKRLHRLADKGLAEQQKAEHYAEAAEAAEHNRAVSSDDPEALRKLREKLAAAEALQARMKAANVAIRKHAKAGPEAQVAALVEQGLSESTARKLLTPDFCGRIGFADYALTNNSAERRRTKKRIAELEASAGAETVAREVAGIRVVENVDLNRLQLLFPGKPDEATRRALKAHGFRWAPSEGAWQRHLNEEARWATERLLATIGGG